MKVLEIAEGAVFALTRFSLARSSIETWLQAEIDLLRTSEVGGGGSNQDTFDHDKGQKSAIAGRRLHWRLSTGFFLLFLQYLCAI